MEKFTTWNSDLNAKAQGAQKSYINELNISNNKLYFLNFIFTKKITALFCYDLEKKILKQLTSDDISIGNRVHEYGGTSYWINHDYIYFSNILDNNLYKLNIKNNNILKITKNISNANQDNNRFADGDCYKDNFVCVKEESFLNINKKLTDQTEKNTATEFNKNVINSIILYNNKNIITLHDTQDFYAYPRISPNGKKILWVSWNNPNMHWDEANLWVADIDLDDGRLFNIKKIISQKESVFQPEWIDDNNILYISDRNNWWNLYKYNLITNLDKIIIKGKFEIAEPLYVLGRRGYSFNKDYLFFISNFNADGKLGFKKINDLDNIKSNSSNLEFIDTKYNIITGNITSNNNKIYVLADNCYESVSIIEVNLDKNKANKLNLNYDINYNLKLNILSKKDISCAKPISFLNQNNDKVYAFYYPPKNKKYDYKSKKPPLIVMCHGGPIGSTMQGLNFKIQFWTNRGFAVVDVNYSGSTGYGRDYRKRLSGNWGIIDVADCYYAAKYLINNNIVDKDKIIIRGSSAGGMLVLNALAYYDIFKAGACYYPVTDLEYFEQIFNMHKYEAKYNTQLIGEYPDKNQDYKKRSPINNAIKIKSPVIFFHGLNDKIVPYQQSLDMVKKLEANKIYCECYTFVGEGHSFKKTETLEQAFSKELDFYQKIL